MGTVILCPPRIGQGALLWAGESQVQHIHALADVLSLAGVSEVRQPIGQSQVRWQDGIVGELTYLCCTVGGFYLRRAGASPAALTRVVAYDELLGPVRTRLLAV